MAPPIESSSSGDHNSADSGYNSLNPSPAATRPREVKTANVPIPSEINDLYTDFKVNIADSLRGSIRGDVLLSLKYLVLDNSSGRWYIIAQCDADVYKEVCKFFKKRYIKAMLAGKIFTKVIEHQVTWLQFQMDSKLAEEGGSLPVFCDDEERETFCGTRIEVKGPTGTSEATFGGLIKVIKSRGASLYGITASHGLAHHFRRVTTASSNISQQGAGSTDGEAGDADGDGDESGTDSETWDEDDGWDSDLFRQLLRPTQGRGVETPETRPNTVPKQLRQMGTVAEMSFGSTSSLANRDWALLELPIGGLRPNSLPPTTGGSMQRGAGPRATFNTGYASTGAPESSVHALAITCRGPQGGTLKVDGSSALISPGSVFVNTLSFTPKPDSGLMYGDSGSWVVHPKNGVVFGHVVALDCFGEARVIPMNDTLADIKFHLRALDVSISTYDDILTDISTDGSETEPSSRSSNRALDPQVLHDFQELDGSETEPPSHSFNRARGLRGLEDLSWTETDESASEEDEEPEMSEYVRNAQRMRAEKGQRRMTSSKLRKRTFSEHEDGEDVQPWDTDDAGQQRAEPDSDSEFSVDCEGLLQEGISWRLIDDSDSE